MTTAAVPRTASVVKTGGVAGLSEDALRDVWWGCWRRGWNPDGLVAYVSSESNWNPAAVNPSSGATGLAQFMPTTAKGLGTTVEDLRTMTVRQQLPWVFKYFDKASGGKPIPILDFKVLGFSTAHPPGSPDDTVLYPAGSAGAKANPAYTDESGAMTFGSVRAKQAMYIASKGAERRSFEVGSGEPAPAKKGGFFLKLAIVAVPVVAISAALLRRKRG
ncbi:MAG: transglycosylase SLT domain-containing protein [Chromatiaceae bacterium]